MSLPLTLACLWVVGASITALLPMRWQYVPGVALLLLAPVLLVWIGTVHGALLGLLGMLAVLSIFRRPLFHLARQVGGWPAARRDRS